MARGYVTAFLCGILIAPDYAHASRGVCQALEAMVDEVVCASMPEPIYAVGLWYEDFEQTSDAVVCALLARAAYRPVALVHAVERDEAPETSAAGLG